MLSSESQPKTIPQVKTARVRVKLHVDTVFTLQEVPQTSGLNHSSSSKSRIRP